MKEIEILVEVFDQKETVLQKLSSFQEMGAKEVLDIYFFDSLREDLKPDSVGRLSACFRLRQKGGKNYLAYKKDNFDNSGMWIYSDEDEVEVSDLRITENIIEHLGFEVLVTIKNLKYTFETPEYEIVLEEVDNLGLFLEVEKKVVEDDENINEIKKEILDFIKSLNIKISAELNLGKPELMLRKNK